MQLTFLYLVSATIVKDCFVSNTTIVNVINAPSHLIDWFATLNSVCSKLGANELQRNSVPQGQLSNDQIEALLKQLQSSSEPWHKMKLIVLGHGRIGKTTLVDTLRNLLDPSHSRRV